MSLVTIEDTTLTSIANAIREKNGTTDAYKPSEMPTAISNIETGGGSGGGSTYKPRATSISFKSYKGTELDYELENLNTEHLTTLSNMFEGCTKLINVKLKGGIPNVTTMAYIFKYCTSLVSVDFSEFRESAVTSIAYMCSECSALETLDMGNLKTPNLKTVTYAFNKCTNLKRLILTNMTIPNATNVSYMFNMCESLEYLDIRSMEFPGTITTNTRMIAQVPFDCEIIVKDDTARNYLLSLNNTLTNIKTVAEL